MKVLANLGKLDNQRNIIVIEKGGGIEYVVTTRYDPETQSWGSGSYFYSLDAVCSYVQEVKYGLGYSRMAEIATCALTYLADNGELEDFFEDQSIDLSEDEAQFFELELKDEDE